MIEKNITIENARIGFRNFKGVAGTYNAEGNRNFCVFLDFELAQELERDGWNVKWLKPREEGEPEQGYIQVSVRFGKIPPKVVLISSHSKTVLDESTIGALDWAEIKKVDVIIRPYNWVLQEGTKNEKSGVKAYVKSLYVTIAEDEFEGKYLDIPTEGLEETDAR